MNDKITLLREPGPIFTLKHSRAAAVKSLVVLLVFFTLFYWSIVRPSDSGGIQVVILLAALLFVAQGSHLAMVCRGLAFSFNPQSRIIMKNNKQIAVFDEVEMIQVRTIDSDGATEYRLALILHDDGKIHLAQTTDEKQVMRIADELADVLGAPVRKRSFD